MTPDERQELCERQRAFFIERLTGDKARAEWEARVAGALSTLLACPVDRVATPGSMGRAIEAATAPAAFAEIARPLTGAIWADTVARLREEAAKVGAFVPERARKNIERLLAKPNAGAERLLRQILAQEAMEETMRDVLYDALKEFNERVNPFVAEWGLPAILSKLGPFGFGPVAKAIETVKKEFDRRLEPEMRRFLQSFSRKALDRTADLLSKGGGRKWSELRAAVVAWIYAREVREWMADVDEESAALVRDIALDITEHTLSQDERRRERREKVTAWLAKQGGRDLAGVLSDHGAAPSAIDAGAIAEATWPVVKAMLMSEWAAGEVGGLLREFFGE